MQIKLSQNKFALVDGEDFEFLNQYKWHYHRSGYAGTNLSQGNSKFKYQMMHKLLLRSPENMEVDHINGNKLDNRKSNLRVVTKSQNKMNVPAPTNNTSGFKGVAWNKYHNKWASYIKINQKVIHLGFFTDKNLAIKARKDAEVVYFKEYAYVN